LHVHTNQLSGAIPTQIGLLSNINIALMSLNQFTMVPNGMLFVLVACPKVYFCFFPKMETEIGGMTSLMFLYLQNNAITNFPTQLGLLTNLTKLLLSDNKISTTIPTEIGFLTNLQYLYVIIVVLLFHFYVSS
jgi:Leucine-rich repeat (LRR) protein